MATVNQRLLDEYIGHQVDLQHYSNSVFAKIIGLLNRLDGELQNRLSVALEQYGSGAFSVERLDTLLQSVRDLNAQAYAQIGRELPEELRQFAEYEAGFQYELFQSTLPPQVIGQVGLAQVNAGQVYAAAMARPFQGRLLREWASGIEQDRMFRIRDEIRKGFVSQETTDQIIRRIRGTRAKGYSDGLLEIDRRAAEAVVRTAISHVAGVARDNMHEANADILAAIRWVSTLDTRTSDQCRPRDNLTYTVKDHKPIGHKFPWLSGPGRLHWRCRSCSSPVVKSWRELGIDIADMDKSTRASMDGQVPEDTKYGDWLKRQSQARQDQVLGPVRAKLFRQGKSLETFYDGKGRYLTLDELKQRDAAKRAG